MKKTSKQLSSLTVAVLSALSLAGCSGGGGGGSSAPAPEPVVVQSDVAASCTDCSAVDGNTYSGAGVGVWHKTNTGTADEDVTVGIEGVAGQDVTLILTNETNTAKTLAAIRTSIASVPRTFASVKTASQPSGSDPKAEIAEFNRTGWAALMGQQAARATVSKSMFDAPPRLAVIGDTRAWNHYDNSVRNTTLKKQMKTADGVTVNVWLENSEALESKVSAAMLDKVITSYAGSGNVYDMLKDVGGPLWGPHAYPNELICGTCQPIDIVLLNFDNNAQPYGVLGYFYAGNNIKKTVLPQSNESVSLYIDTETMYLDPTSGLTEQVNTLAHETMHMSNFYRRSVLMGPAFGYDLWLEEMTAMMMEDATSSRLNAANNPTRETRYPDYLFRASYNCALLNFTDSTPCDSYSNTGSFGGYLLRQMGMPFFRNLLAQNVDDSEAALTAAIKSVQGASTIGEQMRKFSVAAVSALPAAGAPAGFGFPQRVDGAFSIPAIDAETLKQFRTLPSAAPTTLEGYASFPVVRKAVSGTFSEVVRVPAGSTLSVVVN